MVQHSTATSGCLPQRHLHPTSGPAQASTLIGPTPWTADYSSLKRPVMQPWKRTLRPPMPPCCREPPGLRAPPPSRVVPHPPRLGTIALSNVPPCRALHPRHSLLPEASLLLPPSPPRGGEQVVSPDADVHCSN